ncbi:hypothetical protein VHA01S_005_00990 [Vibrio halioticoli NBRC 102217]|uniref:Uncharacterized protein n=1 Tax=Vibrio halioticoli NBRC 102217 TaxID=1219072 RepID=V5FF42_9VIBR|nr:hypothetical protein [Vibrio halioticoli]GAD88496.1 hypothetical protein VHA01S_005_00990 [Vibrio halioticoli NBRC 102217]
MVREALDVQDSYRDEYSDYAQAEIIKDGGEIVAVAVSAFQKKVSSIYDKYRKENPSLVLTLDGLQGYEFKRLHAVLTTVIKK